MAASRSGKCEWENEIQWEARRQFIEYHKDSYPVQRLEALSMVWSNMKFFGCRYPVETETIVNELDVQCSVDIPCEIERKRDEGKKKAIFENFTFFVRGPDEEKNAISLLYKNTQRAKRSIEFQELPLNERGLRGTAVVIDGTLIATGEGLTKKEARKNSAEQAVKILKASQPVVDELKVHQKAKVVGREELAQGKDHPAPRIADSNIGYQMLRRMGWVGGGVGSVGNKGRAEPVIIVGVQGRQGLGQTSRVDGVDRISVKRGKKRRNEDKGKRMKERGPMNEDKGKKVKERRPRNEDKGKKVKERGPMDEGEGSQMKERGPMGEGEGSQMKERIPWTEDEGNKKAIFENFTFFVQDSDKEKNVISLLFENTRRAKRSIEFQEITLNERGLLSTAIVIDGTLIATGEGSTKKEARKSCAEQAVKILKASQPVVDELKTHQEATIVDREELVQGEGHLAPRISDSDIGSQMLGRTGWVDGGVESIENKGRVEPVMIDGVQAQQGLGQTSQVDGVDRISVKNTIRKFIANSSEQELRFSSSLSGPERCIVHKVCQEYKLRHKSFGKGTERYLVISKR